MFVYFKYQTLRKVEMLRINCQTNIVLLLEEISHTQPVAIALSNNIHVSDETKMYGRWLRAPYSLPRASTTAYRQSAE